MALTRDEDSKRLHVKSGLVGESLEHYKRRARDSISANASLGNLACRAANLHDFQKIPCM
jgi:hypothetical protein